MSKRPLVRPLAWAPGDRGSGPVCLGFPGKTFSPLICFLTWRMGTKPVSPGTEELQPRSGGQRPRTPRHWDAPLRARRGAMQAARWARRPGLRELRGLRLEKLGCRGGRRFSPLHWAGKLFLRILLCSRRFRACKRSRVWSEQWLQRTSKSRSGRDTRSGRDWRPRQPARSGRSSSGPWSTSSASFSGLCSGGPPARAVDSLWASDIKNEGPKRKARGTAPRILCPLLRIPRQLCQEESQPHLRGETEAQRMR